VDPLAANPFRGARVESFVGVPERLPGEAKTMANASTVEITQANFKQVVERDGIVLIDWWAPWCGPCRVFGPTFEKVAQKHPDVVFGKVNTEDQPDLAGAFDIRSIPTLMILRDKVLLFSQPGALPEAALEDLIRQVRGLDMEKVRADIAAQEAKQGQGDGAKVTPA
jgi:thioredoxin 1